MPDDFAADPTPDRGSGVPSDAARRRALSAMAAVIAERGYANTRVSDVIKRARMSRRTFYRLFRDREECFLAAYDEACRELVRDLDACARDGGSSWTEVVQRGVGVLAQRFAEDPATGHLLMVEPPAVGGPGRDRHEETMRRMADLLASVRDGGGSASVADEAAIGAVAHVMATRLINGEAAQLPDMTPRLAGLVTRLCG